MAENFLMIDYGDDLNYQSVKDLFEIKLMYNWNKNQERYSN